MTTNEIASLIERLRRIGHQWVGPNHPAVLEAADALEACQAERDKWHEAWHKEEQATWTAFKGGYAAALEEAAVLTETWHTRDGALADADHAKHDIAAKIRALAGAKP